MAVEWYVGRDGQMAGPMTYDDLLQARRDATLRPDDLVWRTGLEEWVRAETLSAIWAPPPPIPAAPVLAPLDANERPPIGPPPIGPTPIAPSPPPETGSAPAAEPSLQNPAFSDREARRFWRGEVSLAKSYWLYGIALSILAALLTTVAVSAIEAADLSSNLTLLALAGVLGGLTAVFVWQAVGIWRSAGMHMRSTGRKFWAVAARLGTTYGVVQYVVAMAPAVTVMSETVRLALGHDDTPAYHLRLMRDGTELELSGGMPIGTAAAVRTFLDAAPGIKVVHLNSLGGRVAEGYELLQLFQERRIATYTSANCYSACTIAFLGGVERYLSTEAKLGFHSASLAGFGEKDLPGINDGMHKILVEHGASAVFVNKVLATDASSMWYPTTAELLESRIITAVVDPGDFALSGISTWNDREAIAKAIADMPYGRALKEHDPATFEALAVPYAEALKLGRTRAEVTALVRQHLSENVMPRYLRVAPDAALIRYWKSQIAKLNNLAAVDPELCVDTLGLATKPTTRDASKLHPQSLLDEDMDALVGLIEATHALPAPPITPAARLERFYDDVHGRVQRTTPAYLDFVADPARHADKPEKLCRAFVAFFTAVIAAPPEQAGAMLRDISSKE